LIRKGIAVGTILLFLVSVVPFIHGEPDDVTEEFTVNEDSYQYAMDWSVYLTNQTTSEGNSELFYTNIDSFNDSNTEPIPLSGPMDSAWPMHGHDVFHTCRSNYSTENNLGIEIWRVRGDKAGAVWGSAVVDNNGITYFGTHGSDSSLYAMYPNGIRKWRFHASGIIWETSAIA